MKRLFLYIILILIIYFKGFSNGNKNSIYVVLKNGSMPCYNFLLIKDIVSEDSVCIVSDKLEINNYIFLRKIKLNDTLKLDIYPCNKIKKINDSCYCCYEKFDSSFKDLINYAIFMDSTFIKVYCSYEMYNLSLPDSCFINK